MFVVLSPFWEFPQVTQMNVGWHQVAAKSQVKLQTWPFSLHVGAIGQTLTHRHLHYSQPQTD